MELSLYFKTLRNSPQRKSTQMGGIISSFPTPGRGQAGEALLPLASLLVTGSLLIGSLLWLSRHFEIKTKEHLNDFRKDWNSLEQKYQK